MQKIINFLIRYKTFLLYIFLLLIAFVFTFQSHSYHQSKFLNSANYISGSIYQLSTNSTSYFDLREENESLLKENEILRRRLYNKQSSEIPIIDSTITYTVITGQVVKNSYAESTKLCYHK